MFFFFLSFFLRLASVAHSFSFSRAGSERTKKTEAKGQTLKEALFINKSLSFLEQTVNALSKRQASGAAMATTSDAADGGGAATNPGGSSGFVPFRQSKLTSVLKVGK